MAKQGNAGDGNPMGQDTIDGGQGGKVGNFGFGEENSKDTGAAGKGTPSASKEQQTPDGQVVK